VVKSINHGGGGRMTVDIIHLEIDQGWPTVVEPVVGQP
jgi:hypothetical protein